MNEMNERIVIDLEKMTIDLDLFNKIREAVGDNFLRQKKVIPLFQNGTEIVVAMADPTDISVLDDLRQKTGYEIGTVFGVDGTQILQKIDSIINQQLERKVEIPTLPEQDLSSEPEEEATDETSQKVKIEVDASGAPVVNLVNGLIGSAVGSRASDIHLDPTEEGLNVSFRVDGKIEEVTKIPKTIAPAVVARIKIMSRMNIAEKRLPQDGRYTAVFGGREIDCRVSSFPTIWGEAVVMRLLDRSRLLTLEELGMEREELELLLKLITATGAVLITGPTGSGKTTTLYAILQKLKEHKNKVILTIEDPVEYAIEGIRQSEINERAGYAFKIALKEVLRQDPDIVMVGEIRDPESAESALRLALTGKLVLSTLHTPDAPTAVNRLIEMGIPPYLVASTIEGVVAQRLIRKICPFCKTLFDPEKHLNNSRAQTQVVLPAKQMKMDNQSFFGFFGEGCENCRNTGYRGRVGIFEMMKVDEKIREIIFLNQPTEMLRHAVKEKGGKTLQDAARKKWEIGVTTLEEVVMLR